MCQGGRWNGCKTISLFHCENIPLSPIHFYAKAEPNFLPDQVCIAQNPSTFVDAKPREGKGVGNPPPTEITPWLGSSPNISHSNPFTFQKAALNMSSSCSKTFRGSQACFCNLVFNPSSIPFLTYIILSTSPHIVAKQRCLLWWEHTFQAPDPMPMFMVSFP